MTMSRRVARLGAQSALSIARSRGLGSSFGLLDCRPFPYRQFSELTKDSNLSKNSQEHHSSVVQHEIIKLRGDIEKMQIELRYEIEKTTNKLAREIGAVNSNINESNIYIYVSLFAFGMGILCSSV